MKDFGTLLRDQSGDVIYSIVNSVIDGGNVSEVQISINGDSSIVYQESIKLDEPLSRNQEMIKED